MTNSINLFAADKFDNVKAIAMGMKAGTLNVIASLPTDGDAMQQWAAFDACMTTMATEFDKVVRNAGLVAYMIESANTLEKDFSWSDISKGLNAQDAFLNANKNAEGVVPVVTMKRAIALALLALYGNKAQRKAWGKGSELVALGSAALYGDADLSKALFNAAVEKATKAQEERAASAVGSAGNTSKGKKTPDAVKEENKKLSEANTKLVKAVTEASQQAAESRTMALDTLRDLRGTLVNETLTDALRVQAALEQIDAVLNAHK